MTDSNEPKRAMSLNEDRSFMEYGDSERVRDIDVERDDEVPEKGRTGEKLAMAGVIALLFGGSLALWGLNKEPQPLPAVTSTEVMTSTTATPTTMTKTETRTETPPARTVTETAAARSSVRGPVNAQSAPKAPVSTTAPSTNTTPQKPVQEKASNPAPQGGSGKWDSLAQCEAGGNWSINTGNGYSGGIQASPSTWAAFGGTKYAPTAGQATKAQQIEIGEKILAGQGAGAWPVCSYKAGMR